MTSDRTQQAHVRTDVQDDAVSQEPSAAERRHGRPVDPVRVAQARERVPGVEDAARMTSVLSLVADPTRARVLYALDVVEELCVGDRALVRAVREAAVGYALRLLRTAGLVSRRQEGRAVFYRLADGFPEPLLQHCVRQLITLSRSRDDDDGGGP